MSVHSLSETGWRGIMAEFIPIAPAERSEDCGHNLYSLIIFNGFKRVVCGDCEERLV